MISETAFKSKRTAAAWRLGLSLIVIAVANLAATWLAGMIAGRRSGHVFVLLESAMALACVLGGLSLLRRVVDRDSQGTGLRGPAARQAARGLLLGFILAVAAYVLLQIFGDINANIYVNSSAFTLFAAGMAIVATTAMLDQIMLRGYAFERVLEVFGNQPVIAAAVWSAISAAVLSWTRGASFGAFVNATLIGTLLCLAVLKTRSLWMPWGIQLAWIATLGLLLGLRMSAIPDIRALIRSEALGPAWVTGGSSFDGGALCAGVLAAALAVRLLHSGTKRSERISPAVTSSA